MHHTVNATTHVTSWLLYHTRMTHHDQNHASHTITIVTPAATLTVQLWLGSGMLLPSPFLLAAPSAAAMLYSFCCFVPGQVQPRSTPHPAFKKELVNNILTTSVVLHTVPCCMCACSYSCQ